ncbi:hypothetical protein B5P45_01950 [Phyllobacterium zundukense]|uniref:Uncharacterized protein n=1 Tax=Phyllobacterium zundukense TaxID=1867719 RepID=A0A2N9W4B7_9HYPH|nr:hypothetical protein BLM14_10130 [Phyllobacterium zundukense]PIO46585.1 hypothetical protein B5P45_01950 [Phyllobacterium zundukense]
MVQRRKLNPPLDSRKIWEIVRLSQGSLNFAVALIRAAFALATCAIFNTFVSFDDDVSLFIVIIL